MSMYTYNNKYVLTRYESIVGLDELESSTMTEIWLYGAVDFKVYAGDIIMRFPVQVKTNSTVAAWGYTER